MHRTCSSGDIWRIETKRRCSSVTAGTPHIEPTTGNGDATGCDGLKVAVTRNSNHRRCSWTDGCNINISIRYNMDYTSVTSIIHCRHVITILFHDCDKLQVRSVAAAGENGVGKMLSTCSQYNLQLSSWSCWWRLLFIARLLSIVKIWSAVYFFWYLSDDKNADYIKIWECCLPPVTAVCIRRFVFHMA